VDKTKMRSNERITKEDTLEKFAKGQTTLSLQYYLLGDLCCYSMVFLVAVIL
jgi:hypothetical protein